MKVTEFYVTKQALAICKAFQFFFLQGNIKFQSVPF